MKPKIWMYWDNPPGKTSPPAYIKLCWESIHKHCGEDFDIHLITTENVRQFLPNISDSFFNIAQINNRSNYLRYHLLYEYGGAWLDSDLILFKSFKSLFDLLQGDTDLVATASPSLKYGELESGFLISKKRGKVISKAVAYIDHMVDIHQPGHIFKWGNLGPSVIRYAVKYHKYHHLDCSLISPIASWQAFKFDGIEPINKYCDNNSFGIMLFNEMFRQANSPILSMNNEQLLNTKKLIGQIFRKALNVKTY